MDTKMMQTKKTFVPSTCEIINFQSEDIITASNPGGGFEGEWDTDIPKI